MIEDPEEVRKKLRRTIEDGYDPDQSWESAVDHDANWLVLSEEEFDSLKAEAIRASGLTRPYTSRPKATPAR